MLIDKTQIYIGTTFQGRLNNTYTILMCVPFSTAISFLGIYSGKKKSRHTCLCKRIFTAGLFIIANTWKLCVCL